MSYRERRSEKITYLVFSGRTFLAAPHRSVLEAAQLLARRALLRHAFFASADAGFVATASIRRTRVFTAAAFELAVLLVPTERSLVVLAFKTGELFVAMRAESVVFIFLLN